MANIAISKIIILELQAFYAISIYAAPKLKVCDNKVIIIDSANKRDEKERGKLFVKLFPKF